MVDGYKLATAPGSEPLTLAQVKLHLKVETTADDNEITRQISAARRLWEHYTQYYLISQAWDLIYPVEEFTEEIRIPLGPLVTVDAVAAVYNNAETLATASTYYADTIRGYLRLKSGYTWPTPADYYRVRVSLGVAANAVPEDVLEAVAKLAAWLYANRGDVAQAGQDGQAPGLERIPSDVAAVMDVYRVIS